MVRERQARRPGVRFGDNRTFLTMSHNVVGDVTDVGVKMVHHPQSDYRTGDG